MVLFLILISGPQSSNLLCNKKCSYKMVNCFLMSYCRAQLSCLKCHEQLLLQSNLPLYIILYFQIFM
jgi:hypothetical protein